MSVYINENQTDKLSGYPVGFDADHTYIHRGIAFSSIIKLGDIAAAYYIGFTTPDLPTGKFIHWRPSRISTDTDRIVFDLFEGDTYTGGSAATIFNRNRNLKLSHLTEMPDFKDNVTSTPTGTVIQTATIGSTGSSTQSKTGGSASESKELVLEPNTSYVVRIVPDAATNVTCDFYWYEEEGYKG